MNTMTTDKEKRIEVAKRMKRLYAIPISSNDKPVIPFFHDAVTLMELVLKEREAVTSIKGQQIYILAKGIRQSIDRKQRTINDEDLQMLLDLILGGEA